MFLKESTNYNWDNGNNWAKCNAICLKIKKIQIFVNFTKKLKNEKFCINSIFDFNKKNFFLRIKHVLLAAIRIFILRVKSSVVYIYKALDMLYKKIHFSKERLHRLESCKYAKNHHIYSNLRRLKFKFSNQFWIDLRFLEIYN